jgi:hypothetical protein
MGMPGGGAEQRNRPRVRFVRKRRRLGPTNVQRVAGSRSRSRKAMISIAVAAATAGILGLVLLSPLLIRQLGTLRGVDWVRLSNIGQTYGAASAILSALALGAVAVSLLVQARQTKVQQVQAVRGFHLELLRTTLDDPSVYMPCWGWSLDMPEVARKRQQIFTIMMMNYERMGYEVGVIPELSLRGVFLADMFQSEVGRQYWSHARSVWRLALSESRQGRRFVQIVEDEYNSAVAAGPPSITAATEDDHYQARTTDSHERDWRPWAVGMLGLAGGVIFGARLRRNR